MRDENSSLKSSRIQEFVTYITVKNEPAPGEPGFLQPRRIQVGYFVTDKEAAQEVVRKKLEDEMIPADELEDLKSDMQTKLASLKVAIKSTEEKNLLADLQTAELLYKFMQLEIVKEDWQKIEESGLSGLFLTLPHGVQNSLDRVFKAHFSFYRLAGQRDEILFRNVIQKMKQKKESLSVMVTGGFHSEGITEKLKKSQIKYIGKKRQKKKIE